MVKSIYLLQKSIFVFYLLCAGCSHLNNQMMKKSTHDLIDYHGLYKKKCTLCAKEFTCCQLFAICPHRFAYPTVNHAYCLGCWTQQIKNIKNFTSTTQDNQVVDRCSICQGGIPKKQIIQDLFEHQLSHSAHSPPISLVDHGGIYSTSLYDLFYQYINEWLDDDMLFFNALSAPKQKVILIEWLEILNTILHYQTSNQSGLPDQVKYIHRWQKMKEKMLDFIEHKVNGSL